MAVRVWAKPQFWLSSLITNFPRIILPLSALILDSRLLSTKTKMLNFRFGIQLANKDFVLSHRPTIKAQMELSWFMISLILPHWKIYSSFGFPKHITIAIGRLMLSFWVISQIVPLQLCLVYLRVYLETSSNYWQTWFFTHQR